MRTQEGPAIVTATVERLRTLKLLRRPYAEVHDSPRHPYVFSSRISFQIQDVIDASLRGFRNLIGGDGDKGSWEKSRCRMPPPRLSAHPH
mmetsp:Transcript_54913/g.123615  ORF Transcript_54913/g.123615 Transcript_54913/m.123615 type:complete len:90 (-) Transcript_54913:88-357(-)